jgi:hypothetical protein
MTDNMRVLLVGTALTVTIAVLGSWGGWVTSTLMVVDKRTEVMSGKLDDTHTMLALIIEKMTPHTYYITTCILITLGSCTVQQAPRRTTVCLQFVTGGQ